MGRPTIGEIASTPFFIFRSASWLRLRVVSGVRSEEPSLPGVRGLLDDYVLKGVGVGLGSEGLRVSKLNILKVFITSPLHERPWCLELLSRQFLGGRIAG